MTLASNYGKQTEEYDGFDVTMNARFTNGATLSGGVGTGRTVTNNCDVLMDSPQNRFCEVTLPFASQAQFKLSGSYMLPWSLQSSITYQDLPGIPITSSYVASNAEVKESLGRNLGACAPTATTCTASVTVELIEPNTTRENRIRQVDLRFSKVVNMGRYRLQGNFDLYNAFNASPILSMTTRYGSAWLQPTEILAARIMKVGGTFSF